MFKPSSDPRARQEVFDPCAAFDMSRRDSRVQLRRPTIARRRIKRASQDDVG